MHIGNDSTLALCHVTTGYGECFPNFEIPDEEFEYFFILRA